MSIENIYDENGIVVGGKYTPPQYTNIKSKTAANSNTPQPQSVEQLLDKFFIMRAASVGVDLEDIKRRNELGEPKQELLSAIGELMIDLVGADDKPVIDDGDGIGPSWCVTCETIVSGETERIPCRCDIRNELRAELRTAIKKMMGAG